MTAYTAKRLPVQLGPAAWNAILPPRAVGPALEEKIAADVVIVGAGFAGLSAARQLILREPGLRVIVLEAGEVAEGAAGRNSGFMIDLPHDLSSDDYAGQGVERDKRMIALNRMAIAFAQDAVREYQINPAFCDPVGKVNGAASAKGDAHNRSYAAHLGALGEACELLDAAAMKELTGSNYYVSGLYTPGTCMLQPAGYIRGLAAGLSDTVAIYENTPVTGFARSGEGWSVSTPSASVSANRIILANNGHLESFGFARHRLMHIFLFAVMTPDLDADALARLGGQPRWGITPADPMGTTVRRIDSPLGGNRIVTRTCAVFRPGMKATANDLGRAARVMREKFDARFPKLAGMEMEYSWAGHLCLSRNDVSVMREIETNVFAACCQNGLGTARGTMTGMGAADLALGRASGITAFFNAQDEPEKLPPEPFASIGANAYLRYKEWHAGQE